MKKLVTLISLAAVIYFSACHSGKEEHHHEETKFLVTSPLKKDTTITKEYVCKIQSVNHIELRALERGYLQKIFVDEGQYVKKRATDVSDYAYVISGRNAKSQSRGKLC